MFASEEGTHIGENEAWYSVYSLGIQGVVRSSLSLHPHPCLKAGEDWCPSSKTGRENGFSLILSDCLSYSSLQCVIWGPTILGKTICFTCTDSNVNLIQKYPHRHIQNNI